MEENNKGKKRPVDDSGIRLAPTPIRSDDMNVLPSIRQDFIITPHIEVNEKEEESETASTLRDYQPKKEEMSKRWKRNQRGKNLVVGSILFIVTAFTMLPYLLAVANVTLNLPFQYVPIRFNAIGNVIAAFTKTANIGWLGDGVGTIWLNAIPDLLLIVGFLALVVNLIKSMYALFAAVKRVKFVWCSLVYLFNVLLIFIASLIGIDAIGIEKIDFMNDIIYNTSNSELFTLVIISLGYFIVCFVVNLFSRDSQGYLV